MGTKVSKLNKNNLITLFTLLALFLISPNSVKALSSPNHTMWFGYYHVISQYGDFSSEINYTNADIILEESFIRRPTITNTDIQKLNNAFDKFITLNHKIIYAPAINQGDLSSSIDMALPYWGNIEFIYLADEPNWDKTTAESNITNFRNLVSGKGLAQKLIAVNFTPNQILSGTGYQASNLDIVGTEAYMNTSLQNDAQLVAKLNTQLDQLKQKIGNKKIFFLIQAYSPNGAWQNLNSLLQIQTPAYLKSYNDDKVIGLLAFSYAIPGGTKDITSLKQPHQEIYAAMTGNGTANGSGDGTQTGTPIENVVLRSDLGDGIFPDVVWFQNKVWMAVRQGQQINLYNGSANLSDLTIYKTFNLTTDASGFPRLTVYNNTLWLAYKDGTPDYAVKLWRMDTNATESLGQSDGNDPIALGEGEIAWQKNPNFTIYKRSLTGGTIQEVGPGRPTGLSRITNGEVVLIDTDNTIESWGTHAWFTGNLTVVEAPNGGILGRFNNNQSTQFILWEGLTTNSPHIAMDETGRNIAVVAWDPVGRAIKIGTFTSELGRVGNSAASGDSEENINIPNGGSAFQHQQGPGVPTGYPGLGELIQQIIYWSIRILGIAVFVMIFIAGMQWFFAGGNTTIVNQARSKITNAIVGAIILVSAYVILNTINPDFVRGVFTLPGITGGGGAPAGGGGEGPTAEICLTPQTLAQQHNEPYPAPTNGAPELNTLINCIKSNSLLSGKNVGAIYTYDQDHPLCNYSRGNTVCGTCSHTANSCHYGGRTGNQGALAVDFAVKGEVGNLIIQAANTCGAKANGARCEDSQSNRMSCDSGNATHVHVTAVSCDSN